MLVHQAGLQAVMRRMGCKTSDLWCCQQDCIRVTGSLTTKQLLNSSQHLMQSLLQSSPLPNRRCGIATLLLLTKLCFCSRISKTTLPSPVIAMG